VNIVQLFDSTSDLSSYMQVVNGGAYGSCIATDLVSTTSSIPGVVITGAATATASQLSAPLHGIDFRITFQYTNQGVSKRAEDDVLYFTEGRLRARLTLETCCKPFDASIIQRIASAIDKRMSTAAS
jgi:hypothetical protein